MSRHKIAFRDFEFLALSITGKRDYFDSVAQIQQAMAGPRMQEVLADMPNYYDGGAPDVFVGEVVPLPAVR